MAVCDSCRVLLGWRCASQPASNRRFVLQSGSQNGIGTSTDEDGAILILIMNVLRAVPSLAMERWSLVVSFIRTPKADLHYQL